MAGRTTCCALDCTTWDDDAAFYAVLSAATFVVCILFYTGTFDGCETRALGAGATVYAAVVAAVVAVVVDVAAVVETA